MTYYYPQDFVTGLDGAIGENIQVRRKALGLNQTHISIQMTFLYGFNWNQSHVAKVEGGQRLLKLSEAYAVCEILRIPIEDLARGRELENTNVDRGEAVGHGEHSEDA